jgi:hypothetical protein
MQNAQINEYREGRMDSYTGESKIHQHQGRSYEEALAREGYMLYARIDGKLFRSCNLYILQKADASQSFYIDVAFHSLSENSEPYHQFIYIDNFQQWLEEVHMLATMPGSSIHRIARESIGD